jgi:hypothetical protein
MIPGRQAAANSAVCIMSPHCRLVAALVVVVLALLQLCMLPTICMAAVQYDYGDALMRSLLYFEGQRSGKLPTQQRVTWRGNSGLSDGNSAGVCTSLKKFPSTH